MLCGCRGRTVLRRLRRIQCRSHPLTHTPTSIPRQGDLLVFLYMRRNVGGWHRRRRHWTRLRHHVSFSGSRLVTSIVIIISSLQLSTRQVSFSAESNECAGEPSDIVLKVVQERYVRGERCVWDVVDVVADAFVDVVAGAFLDATAVGNAQHGARLRRIDSLVSGHASDAQLAVDRLRPNQRSSVRPVD